MNGLTFTDVFCGAGGSSSGLAAAGLELKLAANHWDRAIETHAANLSKPVSYPLGSITGRDHHALVVPYRRGQAKPASDPLLTLGTKDSAGLCSVATDVDDCHFRMLKPREHLRGQRFPDSYVVKGNQGEQTMQAGNAVSSNVAQWLGEKLVEALA